MWCVCTSLLTEVGLRSPLGVTRTAAAARSRALAQAHVHARIPDYSNVPARIDVTRGVLVRRDAAVVVPPKLVFQSDDHNPTVWEGVWVAWPCQLEPEVDTTHGYSLSLLLSCSTCPQVAKQRGWTPRFDLEAPKKGRRKVFKLSGTRERAKSLPSIGIMQSEHRRACASGSGN